MNHAWASHLIRGKANQPLHVGATSTFLSGLSGYLSPPASFCQLIFLCVVRARDSPYRSLQDFPYNCCTLFRKVNSASFIAAMDTPHPNNDSAHLAATMEAILARLTTIQNEHQGLLGAVDAIAGKVNVLAGVKQVQKITSPKTNGSVNTVDGNKASTLQNSFSPLDSPTIRALEGCTSPTSPAIQGRRTSLSSKITLTSYPGQSGVDPCPMSWGSQDPQVRGPVVVSRHPYTIRKRNGQ